jgi:hypothetical protein
MGDTSLIRRHSLALTITLLGGVLLAAVALAPRQERIDTYVSGIANRIGYWGDWGTRFHIGEPVALLIDTSMPAGYERIYVRQNGEVVGSLPELSAAQLRTALAAGHQPRASIIDLDPLDPARGVRLRIAFERRAAGSGQPLASRGASASASLL